MSLASLYKAVLIIVFLLVIFELGQALYFMMKDRNGGTRTVWALTRRVILSLLLLILIAVGLWTGILHTQAVPIR